VKPPSGRQPGTLDYWPIPDDVFHSLAMDFVSLPECKLDGQSFDACLVVVCRLSGYIQAVPCLKRGLTSEGVAKLFLKHCVNFMGLPIDILSDNDNLITAEFFESLCEWLGIQQHKAIIYRPKSNGRAEPALGSVVRILRLTLADNKLAKDWVRILPWCLFLLNNLPGVIAGYSPHRIVFGRDLLFPGDLPNDSDCVFGKSFEEFSSDITRLREKISNTLRTHHDRIRRDYLKAHVNRTYSLGDRVWVKVLPKDHTKLSPLWMGPCEITKHLTLSKYDLRTPKGYEILHADSFKPFT